MIVTDSRTTSYRRNACRETPRNSLQVCPKRAQKRTGHTTWPAIAPPSGRKLACGRLHPPPADTCHRAPAADAWHRVPAVAARHRVPDVDESRHVPPADGSHLAARLPMPGASG